jgi:hypothetical protein
MAAEHHVHAASRDDHHWTERIELPPADDGRGRIVIGGAFVEYRWFAIVLAVSAGGNVSGRTFHDTPPHLSHRGALAHLANPWAFAALALILAIPHIDLSRSPQR